MNQEMHKKLVDLYAGHDLPAELEDAMEIAAFSDADLAHDMSTLRRTVDALQAIPKPEFTGESYQRILMKVYMRGGDSQPNRQDPVHIQYQLPIQS